MVTPVLFPKNCIVRNICVNFIDFVVVVVVVVAVVVVVVVVVVLLSYH